MVKNLLYLFTLSVLLFPSISFGQSADALVRNFDIRSYNPKDAGLRDLAFEVRYDGLKEYVEEALGRVELVDVYFQVYWLAPGRFEIIVAGLPEGFEEMRSQLATMVRNRMELVIPEPLTNRLRGYNLRTQSIQGGIQVIGQDPTHSKMINEIFLNFDNEGRMTRIRTQSPMGTNTSELKMSPKSWSDNKWVLDEIEISSIQGIQRTTVKKEIEYKNVSGFGVPKQVKITTTQKLVRPEGDEGEAFEQSDVSNIVFTNFRVNNGDARKVIMPSN